jgi:hypothetical protein
MVPVLAAASIATPARRACWVRSRAATFFQEVRDREGAIASTRGACAPQKHRTPNIVIITRVKI